MLMLPFYRTSLTGLIYGHEINYSEYRKGAPVLSINMDFGSVAYVNLRSLLEKEKKGWRYDLATYAPGRIYSSKYLRVNCLQNIIVINYQRDGYWVQVSKEVVEPCPIPH
jgi:hypothetical protein